MKTDEQQDSKKARVDPDPLPDGWKQDTVTIDKAKLACPVCTHALKPPIFQVSLLLSSIEPIKLVTCSLHSLEQVELLQCAAGHLACGACHGQLADKDRCYRCAHPGGYSRNFPLEDVVRSTRSMCPYILYGCFSSVTLYEMRDHQRKCPHAPCLCSEPGCAFVGSPARVSDHLRDTHSWPVNSIDYGMTCHLQLPESKPRCLLVAKEDGQVFVVSVAALRGVSLVCLRRNAAAGPQYTCKIWVIGSAATATAVKVPNILVEMELPSSAVACEAAASTEDEPALVVQRRMLHGPSKELRLKFKIDKVRT